MVNWSKVFSCQSNEVVVQDFANNALSGRQLTNWFRFEDSAGEIRKLLRNNGVEKARKLARKAISRRPV